MTDDDHLLKIMLAGHPERLLVSDLAPGITNAGLEGIEAIADILIVLNLTQCRQITDEGLKHVGKLYRLQELLMGYCSGLTANGLAHLHGLTDLKHLMLPGDMVDEEGVIKLQSALPNCVISYGLPSLGCET